MGRAERWFHDVDSPREKAFELITVHTNRPSASPDPETRTPMPPTARPTSREDSPPDRSARPALHGHGRAPVSPGAEVRPCYEGPSVDDRKQVGQRPEFATPFAASMHGRLWPYASSAASSLLLTKPLSRPTAVPPQRSARNAPPSLRSSPPRIYRITSGFPHRSCSATGHFRHGVP